LNGKAENLNHSASAPFRKINELRIIDTAILEGRVGS
jgi:hypothetical protein